MRAGGITQGRRDVAIVITVAGSWLVLSATLLVGTLAMGLTAWWLATDRDLRWRRCYRRYPPLDQRLILPIGIATGTLFAALLALA